MGSRAKSFPNARRVYYKPEIRNCPHCAARLKHDHPVSRKFVITLTETIYAVNQGYRCPRAECPGHKVFFRSAVGETLSLKNHSYGMDVLAEVGYLRFNEHYTREEIHQSLRDRGVSISEREVQNLYEEYLILLRCSASEKIAERRPQMVENGGVVISLDGVQPEKGNETLWVVREVLTGTTLNAANLATGDAANLTELLRPVLNLGLPILGVVSDAQKSIRNAVAELFPGVPHQLCHFHFLRDIAMLTVNEDRGLKTDLKHEVRGIKKIEERVADRSDPDAEVIRGYTTALRAVLLEDGRPPLDLPGIKIYKKLDAISQSLRKCLAKRGLRFSRSYSRLRSATSSTTRRILH